MREAGQGKPVVYAAATHTRHGRGEPTDLSRTYLRTLCTLFARSYVNAVALAPAMSRPRDRNLRRKNAKCIACGPLRSHHLGVMLGPPHSLAARLGLSGSKSLACPESQRASAAHGGRWAGTQCCVSAGARMAAQVAEARRSSAPWGSYPAVEQQACRQLYIFSNLYSPVLIESASGKYAGFVRWPAQRQAPASRCCPPASGDRRGKTSAAHCPASGRRPASRQWPLGSGASQ